MCVLSSVLYAQTVLIEASAAIQKGEFGLAEAALRREIAGHPDNAWAHSLLGVALDGQGQFKAARDAHQRALQLAPAVPDILNNYGGHLWRSADYAGAETVFAKAFAASPDSFNILYNLGVMASLAGHHERAREVLLAGLIQQPGNVGLLYRLAVSEEATGRFENAAEHLVLGVKLAPLRADIRKLLALALMESGALADASTQWQRYLELQPDDEEARREAGFTLAKLGEIQKGSAAIEAYVKRHPEDPVGHFELGQAEKTRAIVKANLHFGLALALRPDYAAALIARGSLAYQQGLPEAALPDLERGIALAPRDTQALDRLGQVYGALNRFDDAVRVLRRADDLAYGDPKVVLHLGRALANAGHVEESKVVMDRFKAMGPEKKTVVPAGMVSFLGLTPEQRQADYRRRVEKAVVDNPEDPGARLELLKVAVEWRNPALAVAAGTKLLAMKAPEPILREAGNALITARQYALARQLLSSPTDQARLRILTATAAAEVERALGEFPGLLGDAAPALIRLGKAQDAVSLLGAIRDPNRDLRLLLAAAFDRAGERAEAASRLAELRMQWPEWAAAWAVSGLLDGNAAFLETAVTLGANGPTVLTGLSRAYIRLGQKAKADAVGIRLKGAKSDDPAWLRLIE